MDTLLNLSGGIDSAYCLYDYANRGEPLLLHYCKLINREGRSDQEERAVRNLLAYVKNKFGYSPILLTTEFNYKNAGKPITKDKYIIGFMTAIVLNNRVAEGVTKVIVSSNKEDLSRHEYMERSEAIRNLLMGSLGRQISVLKPIKDMTKEDLIKALPKEYINLTWYCRTPVGSKPCRKCITCIKVIPHL